MTTIHVLLTAYRRLEHTRMTASSFVKHNDPRTTKSFMRLWYALDTGHDPLLSPMLNRLGYSHLWSVPDEPIMKIPGTRYKMHHICRLTDQATRALAEQADPDDLVLLLQNDWETVRALPVNAVRSMLDDPDIGTVRLCGKYISRGEAGIMRDPVSPCSYTRGHPLIPVVKWSEGGMVFGEMMETGLVHWSHNPAVTRLGDVRFLVRETEQEFQSFNRTAALGWRTARFIDNVTFHIGGKRLDWAKQYTREQQLGLWPEDHPAR